MRIGIISDSPLLTTGFGVEADQIARALTGAGHEVACLGLKGCARRDECSGLPFRVWHVDVSKEWTALLAKFLAQERVEVLLIIMDLFNLKEVMSYCRRALWSGPTLLYLTPDGIPAYSEYINLLRSVRTCVVTTRACAEYLSSCGIHVTAIAPPGVDSDVFKPLSNRDALREDAGIANKFVVGVFGRNRERKQQPRVMRAMAHLKETGMGASVMAYFHCRTRGYWDLEELAEDLEIRDLTIFADQSVGEVRGVPYCDGDGDNACLRSPNTEGANMPTHYRYVERINCCDLIVNVPHCGDFEHVIIEAQSCGVPLAHTDDSGIMTEAMGKGGIRLAAADTSYGKIGQHIVFACPKSIAEAIISVRENEVLRQELRERGLDNAHSCTWTHLGNTIVDIVARM